MYIAIIAKERSIAQQQKQINIIFFFFHIHINMMILSLDELKVIAKKRGIKDNENKPEDDLIKILSEPRTKLKLSKKRIKDIREDFNKSRHMFSGLKIKQIRKNL